MQVAFSARSAVGHPYEEQKLSLPAIQLARIRPAIQFSRLLFFLFAA